MNFTTDLPKKNPLVTYIVASAVKCEKSTPKTKKSPTPCFRMHAVILHSKLQTHDVGFIDNDLSQFHFVPKNAKDLKTGTRKSYILCHVRKIDQNYNLSTKQRSKKSRQQKSPYHLKKISKKLKLSSKKSLEVAHGTAGVEQEDQFDIAFYSNSYEKMMRKKELAFHKVQVNLSEVFKYGNKLQKGPADPTKEAKKPPALPNTAESLKISPKLVQKVLSEKKGEKDLNYLRMFTDQF